MKKWGVIYQSGYKLVRWNTSPFKVAVAAVWDFLCRITFGWIGGHGMPSIFWDISLGWPRRYPKGDWMEGQVSNSIAATLLDVEAAILDWAWGDCFDVEIDISREEALAIAPDFDPWEDEES